MEEQELPAGWAKAPLEEVVEILDSLRVPINNTEREARIAGRSKSDLYPYYGATGQVGWIDDYIFAQTLLLLGEDGVPFLDPLKRKAYRVSGKFWVNNHAHVIKPMACICDQAYLESFLNQFDYTGCVTGSTRLKLTQAAMRQIAVPLAPYPEQVRIASKLDTTLAAVESCRQRLDGVAELLNRFRQAVLAAATSGELTREWREERGVSTDSWAQASIIELADQVFDGPFGTNLKSEDYTSDGFRVVRLENISHLRFLEEKRTFISPEKFALLQKHVLFEDDILFSSFVDEEVRTCLLPSALSGLSINKADCFCVRVNRNLCLPGFVVSVLSCRSTFKSLDGLVHGATRPRINLKQLKSLSIDLPPLEEQMEILSRQEQLFTLAAQLESRLNAARKVVDRLIPALLAKAFRGELVPQDPGDEPASVLLERLRAARQAEAGAGTSSRRGRRKAAANPDQTSLDAAPVPPDLLSGLLRECGALSERALLAASELEPGRFAEQLQLELQAGTIRNELEDGVRVLVGGG